MAQVNIQGQFLGAKLDVKKFDGKETISVMLNIFQPDSQLKNNSLNIKCEEVEMLDVLNKTYTFGDQIEVKAAVNSYRNDTYFKLIELVS